MKFVLVRYNNDCEWAKEYTNDILIYDRSEVLLTGENIIRTENKGQVDYDKLAYLIDNYDTLPEVFLWAKANLIGRFVEKEEFERLLKEEKFAPLYRKDHNANFPYYGYDESGMYYELNTSWYTSQLDNIFSVYEEFADYMSIPSPHRLRFPPGGNFILTKECVHKHPKEFYEKARNLLPHSQNPAEAHMLERTYLSLWE